MTLLRSAPPRALPPPPGAALLLALAILAATGCARSGPADPAREMLADALEAGDRVVALHVVDPDAADQIVAVVIPRGGKPELRIYEWHPPGRRGRGTWTLAHRAPQGDAFRNLAVEDVTGDGKPEILATSLGGHLEVLEVFSREGDGPYRSVFENGGREIEKRYAPGGAIEFWVTSRTYEERSGQPPTYVTGIYRWDGRAFTEAAKR